MLDTPTRIRCPRAITWALLATLAAACGDGDGGTPPPTTFDFATTRLCALVPPYSVVLVRTRIEPQ
jgi:hypothetical protein